VTGITLAFDAMHVNVPRLPKGCQAVGYATGPDDIRWTPADAAMFPNWVQGDQDARAVAYTADFLDHEAATATAAEAATWAATAWADYRDAVRPGQRVPLIYASLSDMAGVTEELATAKIPPTRVGLYIAHWGIDLGADATILNGTYNGYPVHGFQFQKGTYYDYNIFSAEWLNTVSFKGMKPTEGIIITSGFTAVTSTDGGKNWS
jgi:hypothetical protein